MNLPPDMKIWIHTGRYGSGEVILAHTKEEAIAQCDADLAWTDSPNLEEWVPPEDLTKPVTIAIFFGDI